MFSQINRNYHLYILIACILTFLVHEASCPRHCTDVHKTHLCLQNLHLNVHIPRGCQGELLLSFLSYPAPVKEPVQNTIFVSVLRMKKWVVTTLSQRTGYIFLTIAWIRNSQSHLCWVFTISSSLRRGSLARSSPSVESLSFLLSHTAGEHSPDWESCHLLCLSIGKFLNNLLRKPQIVI